MDGQKYVEMLSEKLKLHMHVYKSKIFRLCRTAHLANVFKSQKAFWKSNIELLDWPGNSLDLNQIENLWTNMKNKVSEKQPLSAAEFIKVIKKVWIKEISKEYYQRLIDNKPRRME